MAKRYDIRIDQGSTFILNIRLRDEDDEVISLSGCTAQAMIRYNYSDASAAATFETSINNNIITLTLTDESSSVLSKTIGVWDCEVTWTDGSVSRVIEGKVHISPEVTK